jgi:hypothetical protein
MKQVWGYLNKFKKKIKKYKKKYFILNLFTQLKKK